MRKTVNFVTPTRTLQVTSGQDKCKFTYACMFMLISMLDLNSPDNSTLQGTKTPSDVGIGRTY
jgi:hypothetical protein